MPGIHRQSVLRALAAMLIGCGALPPDAVGQPCGVEFNPPWTVTLPDALHSWVGALIEGSPTFHVQWQTLARVAQLRLKVEFNSTLPDDSARTRVYRYEYGLIVAVVELPLIGHRAELLGHEFEHVVEQIEGLDLRRAAHVRSAGVYNLGYGFETQRAHRAGRQVAREWAHFIYSKDAAQSCRVGF
jgi:hypothetical protein